MPASSPGTLSRRRAAAAPAQGVATAVVGVGEEPDVLVQDFSLRHVTWAVLSTIMLKLVRYDDRWRAWPQLAEQVPTRSNGLWRTLADGRTEVVWRLRTGLRWHDGAPVTASDALFTYELLRATPPPYPHQTIVESISEMFVPRDDPGVLVVRWRPEDAFAPYEEWGTVLPRHVLAGEGLEDPAVREQHWFLRAPLLNGPYRFVEWEPGSHLTVEAVRPHPLGTARLDRIVFRFYSGPEEIKQAVVDGEVDVTDLTGFSTDEMAAVEAEAPELETLYVPSLTWEHVDFNLDDPVLADRRVRQAIAYAIDREQISTALYRGHQPVAHSWLPPRHPGSNPDVRRYDHDLRRAEELLGAAGFRRGADGFLHDAAGERLALELLTTRPSVAGGRWTASATRPAVAAMLKEQLCRAGIDLQVRLVPPDEAFPLFRRRKFPHLAMFAWSMGLETSGYLMWHSSKIPDDNEWYGINVSGWHCAENDRILDELTEEGDEERRLALMREQQAIWAEELPALPLFFPVSMSTRKPGLRNIRPAGVFGTYVTWNAWEWSWDPAVVAS